MDAPHCQRSMIDADSSHDYITNLPANVKDNILLKLPIEEIVRSSILSRKWIYFWVSIPHLVFEQKRRKESELIEMVDAVLLGHQGPIQKFALSSYDGCDGAIGRWLLNLSRNGIKNLELEFSCGYQYHYQIPSRLFSCIELERLCLQDCSINIPSFFQGFKQLHTLILFRCNLSAIGLEIMVSSCPLLDHLVLDLFRTDIFRIRAPNLTRLTIGGEIQDIFLETPKLALACIYYITPFRDHLKRSVSVARDRKESNIIRALGCLSNIQKLDIGGTFIQYLATGSIPENLPAIFSHLTDLSMCMEYVDINPNDIYVAALCLFKNAPNLEVLSIQFNTTDQPDVEAVWESKSIQDCLFKQLKVVKLEIGYSGITFTNIVLEFAKLVLSTAPILEKLELDRFMVQDAEIAFTMLKSFPKLSESADIAFGHLKL